jgi:hypothetical protein
MLDERYRHRDGILIQTFASIRICAKAKRFSKTKEAPVETDIQTGSLWNGPSKHKALQTQCLVVTVLRRTEKIKGTGNTRLLGSPTRIHLLLGFTMRRDEICVCGTRSRCTEVTVATAHCLTSCPRGALGRLHSRCETSAFRVHSR